MIISIADMIEKLFIINNKIWHLETDIRTSDDLELEEVGRRALLIRDLNKQRISIKNSINSFFGDKEFKEIKVDHRSM